MCDYPSFSPVSSSTTRCEEYGEIPIGTCDKETTSQLISSSTEQVKTEPAYQEVFSNESESSSQESTSKEAESESSSQESTLNEAE